jgi:hypothetical protein
MIMLPPHEQVRKGELGDLGRVLTQEFIKQRLVLNFNGFEIAHHPSKPKKPLPSEEGETWRISLL